MRADSGVGRECPVCGHERVVSPREAREVYASDAAVNRLLDRTAARVLAVCTRPECLALLADE